jgi:hypothetical protein
VKNAKFSVANFLLGADLMSAILGCTTVDPYTGQERIDYGATTGVIGLGLGAAALRVAGL